MQGVSTKSMRSSLSLEAEVNVVRHRWKSSHELMNMEIYHAVSQIWLFHWILEDSSHYSCHFHSSWLTYWFERRGCSHARLFKQCCQCKVNRCRVNRISVTVHVMICLQIAVPNAQEQGQGPSLHCQGWAVETQICLNFWHCNWLHEWIKVKRDEMKSDSIHFNTIHRTDRLQHLFFRMIFFVYYYHLLPSLSLDTQQVHDSW